MTKPTKRPKAPWTKAFPSQVRALHPEHSVAGGIKARSTPESIRMAVYNAIKEMFLRNDDYCRCGRCVSREMPMGLIATEIHHKKGRAGWLLVDIRYWVQVSKECHRWIHDHPEEATKLGLLQKR